MSAVAGCDAVTRRLGKCGLDVVVGVVCDIAMKAHLLRCATPVLVYVSFG